MRKRLICAAAVGAVFAVVIVASALATTILRAGNLKITVDATPSPKTLPKKKLAPYALKVSARVQTTDGTHPPALREAITADNNVAINVTGVPVCREGQLESRQTKAAMRVCGKALVGSGKGDVEISFPDSGPIKASTPLLFFNGGAKGNKTMLFVFSYITVPVPATVVTTVTIKKVHNGLSAVTQVPKISGGYGSVLDFHFTIGRKFTYKHQKHTYLEAKCPDGHFDPYVKATFVNDAKVEGVAPKTVLAGHFVVPCTPKG